MARIFLAMNGKKINTIDNLRTNFNGKQILAFYRTGRLQKWLEETGESDLLETVKEFQNENYDDETLLSMLMAVFELSEQQIADVQRSVELDKERQLAEKQLAAETPKVEPERKEAAEESDVEYTPEERNILRIRNKFLSIMRTVLADDMLDYEKHLDVSFADFGISENLQEKLKEKLAVEFKFYPVEYESDLYKHENGLIYVGESPFSVLCSILHKFGPDCFRNTSFESFLDYYEIGSFPTVIKYPMKYKDFLLRGKKDTPKKILSGTLDEWASKGGELPGKIGEFAAALKPQIPEYESADVKAEAELKYHKQKAALALLEDHFKISSDPKTRNQTILLETDLKTHCGFDDNKIRGFNKKLIALFPDNAESDARKAVNNYTNGAGGSILSAWSKAYSDYQKNAYDVLSAVGIAMITGNDNVMDEMIDGAFFETDLMRNILHASIADIFRFCKCL